jgi:hypothetical protein
VNSRCSHITVSILDLMLAASLLLSTANAQYTESERRHEDSDIAKLAAISREDHSTIFFHGITKSGYVRDGDIHIIDLNRVEERGHLQCRGEAVSRDGTRIAYVTALDDASGCRIVVRELKSGEETMLPHTEVSGRFLSWSWDDKEIAYEGGRTLNPLRQEYEGPGAIIAVSLVNGRRRTLAHLPLRIDGGKPRGSIGNLVSVDWLHHRSVRIVNVGVCVPIPDPSPGTCREETDTLLLSFEESRLLAFGGEAAVSPAANDMAFVSGDGVWVIDADGLKRRRITRAPAVAFFLPFFKEETGWSKVVWSPSGDRFWFNTVIGEEFFNNYYLVDLKSGKRQRLRKNSLLQITAWRG